MPELNSSANGDVVKGKARMAPGDEGDGFHKMVGSFFGHGPDIFVFVLLVYFLGHGPYVYICICICVNVVQWIK